MSEIESLIEINSFISDEKRTTSKLICDICKKKTANLDLTKYENSLYPSSKGYKNIDWSKQLLWAPWA